MYLTASACFYTHRWFMFTRININNYIYILECTYALHVGVKIFYKTVYKRRNSSKVWPVCLLVYTKSLNVFNRRSGWGYLLGNFDVFSEGCKRAVNGAIWGTQLRGCRPTLAHGGTVWTLNLSPRPGAAKPTWVAKPNVTRLVKRFHFWLQHSFIVFSWRTFIMLSKNKDIQNYLFLNFFNTAHTKRMYSEFR